MSILKYCENQKGSVGDKFTRNDDPIDRYNTLREKTKELRE
jgi:hypothetical protein